MTTESLNRPAPKEAKFLPPNCAYVFAAMYHLVEREANSGVPHKEIHALIEKEKKILNSGEFSNIITDLKDIRPQAFKICASQEERMFWMVLDLTDQLRDKEKMVKEVPLIIIANEDPDNFVRTAHKAFERLEGLRAEILPRITVIQINAKALTDRKDPVTGIRIATLPKGAIKFPTHPTPNS